MVNIVNMAAEHHHRAMSKAVDFYLNLSIPLLFGGYYFSLFLSVCLSFFLSSNVSLE